MNLSGTATLTAPVEAVWAALNDPAVLARTLPGCESLTVTGPDTYAMRVTAGVAAVRGTYDGAVALTDKVEPSSFTMTAQGSGGPGTIHADVRVRLAPSAAGGTDLSYDAEAIVGGMVGGVGQRMLAGVSRKMAGEFFAAVDDDIAGVRPVAATTAAAGLGTAPVIPEPGVFAGRAPAAGSVVGNRSELLVGLVIGAAIALGGVLIGSRLGRR